MADGGGIGGGMQDLTSTQKAGVNYLGRIVTLLTQLLPRVTGTFTMGAAASTAVANTHVAAGALVFLQAANASAGTLVGSAKSPYISAVTPGVGFTVSTASSTAAGTEIFNYWVVNLI